MLDTLCIMGMIALVIIGIKQLYDLIDTICDRLHWHMANRFSEDRSRSDLQTRVWKLENKEGK